MDPLFDLVRDRTQDLRRTADAVRRDRDLGASTPSIPEQRPEVAGAVAGAVAVEAGAGPCRPTEAARGA